MANTLKFGNGQWAAKKGSTLAYNDENGNFKPLPFDFDRSTSATRVNKEGLIETVGSGQARIDYSDDSEGVLLIEPQSTNTILYSEDFSDGSWNGILTKDLTIVSSTNLDPNGNFNAYKITSTSLDNQLSYLGNVTSGLVYTNSIYIKRISGDGNVILKDINNTQNSFTINKKDGWKRISATNTADTSGYGRFYINLENLGDSIEIFGAQQENKSYPTSYIKTTGSIGTRVADSNVSIINNNLFNGDEGTIFLDFNFFDYNSGSDFSFSDSNSNNVIKIYPLQGLSTAFRTIWKINGVTIFNQATIGVTDIKERIKLALKYKSGESSIWINGIKKATASTTFSGGVFSDLSFSNESDSNKFRGRIKELKYFDSALTDEELQALTTI